MEPLGRITRETRVRDAEKMLTVPAILINETAGLYDMAEKVAESPSCRTLAVVDASGKLKGIIPASQVIDEVFLRIMPEDFISDVVDLRSAIEFAHKLNAKNAKDMTCPPVSVRMDDTVRDAFDRMHKNKLGGLPIVDDANIVIGYLDMLELLLVWVKTKAE